MQYGIEGQEISYQVRLLCGAIRLWGRSGVLTTRNWPSYKGLGRAAHWLIPDVWLGHGGGGKNETEGGESVGVGGWFKTKISFASVEIPRLWLYTHTLTHEDQTWPLTYSTFGTHSHSIYWAFDSPTPNSTKKKLVFKLKFVGKFVNNKNMNWFNRNDSLKL